jgi:hypothetical protein
VNSRTTRRFWELLTELPEQVRMQARGAYRLFEQNPSHPSLCFKRLHGNRPIYSARISLEYRAVGTVSGDEIVWFWIGTHAEYDKLLKSLRG